MPALVVSGINKGWNLGDDVTYSGTVSGALEGALLGVPSIAVSLQYIAQRDVRFRRAARAAHLVAAVGAGEGHARPNISQHQRAEGTRRKVSA